MTHPIRARALRLFLAGAVCAVLQAPPAAAQTMRPLTTELQEAGSGRVELVNDSDRPLQVVVEAHGFAVDEAGQVQDQPLDERIEVKLSAMSLRIPPRQSRFVFFEARADHGPAWFLLLATFSGYPARDFKGLNIQLEMPHYVYLLPRRGLAQDDLVVTGVEPLPASGRLAVTVENRGAQFGRIAEVALLGDERVTAAGFPLFPGQRRRLEFAWPAGAPPRAMTLRTRDFVVERPLPTTRP